MLPASSADSPNAVRADWTVSMDPFTSVPLRSENFKNFSVSPSSSAPVEPNRVFTSPRAVPMSPKSPTMFRETFLYDSISSSAASPVAPVAAMIASAPSSKDSQDAYASFARSFNPLIAALMPDATRSARAAFMTENPPAESFALSPDSFTDFDRSFVSLSASSAPFSRSSRAVVYFPISACVLLTAAC